MHIDPDRLRTLRNAQGLSRASLAERSRVSERTIQRWETGSGASRAVREHTLNQLTKALRVEPDVLTGEAPLPASPGGSAPSPPSVQIGAQVTPKARLAYDLVRRRYGVTATEVINMAPLFFVLLAEGSLAWRREKLREADEAIGRLDEMKDQTGIWLFCSATTVARNATVEEQESIDKTDLFGTHLWDRGDGFGDSPFDQSETNPFAGYLRKLASDLGEPSVVDVERESLSYGFVPKFPDYDICGADLECVANGSADARRALESGDARLSEIPQELTADDVGEKRAAWLEGKLSDAWKGLEDDSPPARMFDLLATSTPEEQGEILKELIADLEERKAEEIGGDE